MGREIRRVPRKWNHPKQIITRYEPLLGDVAKEVYRPMYQQEYKEAVDEFNEEMKKWFKGIRHWYQGFYWDSFNDKLIPIKEKLDEWYKHNEKERIEHGYSDTYLATEQMRYKTGICSWTDVAGDVPLYPNPEDYMPFGEWYQIYETVTEGTPVTPSFETVDQLIEWLSKNTDFVGATWTPEQVRGLVKQGSVPSFVVENGKLYKGQETLEDELED